MKQSLRLNCLTLGLAVALLTGCVTLSVYPYYTTKDLEFDQTLLGTWTETDKADTNPQTWLFEQINRGCYRLTITDADEKTGFDARLFRLTGQSFLDCLTCKQDDFSTPCHVLLRVNRLQPTLELRPLDYDWVRKLIKSEPKTIRHTLLQEATGPGDSPNGFGLTADTAELQKLVRKHLATREAWGEAMTLKRR